MTTTDRLPDGLHRWPDLTDHEQEAIGRLVNRIASQPLPWHSPGKLTRVREWSNFSTAGVEVQRWDGR